jgi:hypothetical protein
MIIRIKRGWSQRPLGSLKLQFHHKEQKWRVGEDTPFVKPNSMRLSKTWLFESKQGWSQSPSGSLKLKSHNKEQKWRVGARYDFCEAQEASSAYMYVP